MVYRHSSFVENWCLCDDIITNEKRSLQALHWQKGHELPASPVTVYERDNVIVTIKFDAEFSNVMVIRALIDADDDDVILDPLQFEIPSNKVRNIHMLTLQTADLDAATIQPYTRDSSLQYIHTPGLRV